MTIPASYLPWATTFLLGFGPDARVVLPPELRSGIAQAAEQVRRMYL